MTTTTRTTRKAPWAAVLTALLAVLALVFGTVAFAGPATADSSPATECEGVANYIGYDKIEVKGSLKVGDTLASGGASITVTADKAGKEATAGSWTTTPYTVRVVVKTGSQTVGSADGFPGYSGTWSTGGQGLSHITFCYTEAPPPPPRCPADAAVHAGEVIPAGQTAETFCTLPPPPPPPPPATCPADAAVHAGEVIPAGQTAETFCTLPPPPPPATCPAGAAVHAGDVIPAGQTAETFCTLPPPEAITPVTAAEAATVPVVVAPVEAATVPVAAPETVAVPAPAQVAVPAAVPAGDGSTVPQVPAALLALLALATAVAVTSGLRMATTR